MTRKSTQLPSQQGLESVLFIYMYKSTSSGRNSKAIKDLKRFSSIEYEKLESSFCNEFRGTGFSKS